MKEVVVLMFLALDWDSTFITMNVNGVYPDDATCFKQLDAIEELSREQNKEVYREDSSNFNLRIEDASAKDISIYRCMPTFVY